MQPEMNLEAALCSK